MKYLKTKNWILLIIFIVTASAVNAQITSGADATIPTTYSSGQQDNIFIFCTSEGDDIAELTASFSTGTGATFEWLKYNSTSENFEAFQTDNSGATSSTINNLQNGGYRVNVTSGGSTETYTAWAFNSWYTPSAEISESNCDYLQLEGSFEQAELNYYDLSNGNPIAVFKDVQVTWEVDGASIAAVISPRLFNPPPRDTNYKLTVYDRFGCEGETSIDYISIVTEAKFSATPLTGEAPLEVTFTNESENADSDGFEWFFFKDLNKIKFEAQETGAAVEDSIMDLDFSENPIYTYEQSGLYQVKLVTTKTSEFHTCTDTFYLEDYIVADTSFIDAPNVFTPNGDGSNDEFVVKYWSIKSIHINIFNRWGKKVHEWENNNVRGFETTVTESAWDGTIGGRRASPGAYYYIVEATGRDDKKRWAHGFVHLLREK